MRIPRVFHDGTASPGEVLELSPREASHLERVLRRGVGDPVRLVSGSEGLHDAEILEAADGLSPRVRVRVTRKAEPDAPPLLPWTLGLALVKAEAFELALRMASELGIHRVAPLVTDRSVVRPQEGFRALEKKAERWKRIAEDAAKQCGRSGPLEVLGAAHLDAFLKNCSCPKRWLAVPSGPVRLLEVVGEGQQLEESAFLVGPEGGFTPVEVARARAAGFEPIGLPTPVLRTPTAVALIAALGALAQGR